MDYKELLDMVKAAPTATKPVKKVKKGSSLIQYSEDLDLVLDNAKGDRFIFAPSKDEYSLTSKQYGKTWQLKEIQTSGHGNDVISDFIKNQIEINNNLVGTVNYKIISAMCEATKYPWILNAIKNRKFTFKSSVCTGYLLDKITFARVKHGYWSYYSFDETRESTPRRKINDEFVKAQDSFYMWLCDNTSFLTSDKFNREVIFVMLSIKNFISEDMAKYFAAAYNKSSMQIVYRDYGEMYDDNFLKRFKKLLLKIDARRLIDYICFELYIQGLRSIEIRNVIDYMSAATNYNEASPNVFPVFSENFITDNHVKETMLDNDLRNIKEITFSSTNYTAVMTEKKDSFWFQNKIPTALNSYGVLIKNKDDEVMAYSLTRGLFEFSSIERTTRPFSYLYPVNGHKIDAEMNELLDKVSAYMIESNIY